MSLLTQTAALYQSFRAERPATDAAVLQLREFLTNQFGHDGTKAWKFVDEHTHTQQKQVPGERTLRRFQHPLTTRKFLSFPIEQKNPIPVTVVEERVVEPTVVNEAGVRLEDGTVVPLNEAPVDTAVPGGGDDLGKSEASDDLTKENLPSTFPNVPAAVADKLIIDLSEASELKPKVASAKYTRDQLVATLEKYQVPFNDKGSNTQLAATLINFAKEKVG